MEAIPRIATVLHHYKVDIDTWSADMAETHMTLGDRMFLHEHLADMTTAQRAELACADALAVATYARCHSDEEDPYGDIRYLGEIVAVIESERAEESKP